jgi:thioredoxin-related protein
VNSLFVGLMQFAFIAAPPPSDGLVHFMPYREAAQQSRAHQKLMLLYFTDPHCGPCRAMENQVFANPKAAATINSGFFPVKVVVNGPKPVPAETRRLTRQFGVQGGPSVLIVSPSGSELRRFGWSTRTEIIGILNHFAFTQGAPEKAP